MTVATIPTRKSVVRWIDIVVGLVACVAGCRGAESRPSRGDGTSIVQPATTEPPAASDREGFSPAALAPLVEQATAAYNRGDFARVERLVATCMDAERAAVANLDLVRCLALRGSLLTEQARFTEAEAVLKRALAMGEQLNPRHGFTGLVLSDLADLYVKMPRNDAAESYAVRAVDVLESAGGFGFRHYPGALHKLGKVRFNQHRDAEADELYSKALNLYERIEGQKGPNVAAVAADLGELRRRQGKLLEARPLLQRAFDIYDSQRRGGHPFAIVPLVSIAELDNSVGRYAESEREFRLAISRIEQIFGVNSPALPKPLWGLGGVLTLREQFTEAESAFRRGLEISQHTSLGVTNPDIEAAENHYALFLWNRRRYPEALKMVQLMLDQMKGRPNPDPKDVATATYFRAQVLEELHDFHAAGASFETAIELRKRLYPAGDPAVEEVVAKYAELRASLIR